MLGTTHQLIKPVSRFQRAIHVRYDQGDAEIISQYIPTDSATDAVDKILKNTNKQATQRAHVLHAAYGSGKSHLAVVLSALLEKSASVQGATNKFVNQLDYVDHQTSVLAQQYIDGDVRLFPVILSGNEGDFSTSILRALVRSINEANFTNLQLMTRFDTAIQTIDRWHQDYPDVVERFEHQIRQKTRNSVEEFVAQLEQHNAESYQLFVEVYELLTAGATFDPFVEQAPEVIYRDLATQLNQYGYSGIVVIWDEFGRYLEGHASQAFGKGAAMFQDFAETCNHSADDSQIHLILLTHKELQGYASALPQSYQQEWSRIEGRFQKHNISTDPDVAYRLISAAIQPAHDKLIYDYLHIDTVDWHVNTVRDLHLFGLLDEQSVFALIEQTFPLHPLAVFALAHVSNRVAQNERTMFTFLTSDEPCALMDLLERKFENSEPPVVYISDLWDYFEDSIRSDIGGTGNHKYWSGVIHALAKVDTDDVLAQKLVKTMGLLSVCNTNLVRPKSEILAWAIDIESDDEYNDVLAVLDHLRRRKAIIHRQIDGFWTFIAGSDINFEEELQLRLERTNPTPDRLQRLLENYIPAPSTLARRYNQRYSMTRFFSGVYRWANDVQDTPWELLVSEKQSDGVVVYILATSELEWQQAFDSIQNNTQVIYVLPRQNQQTLLALQDTLRELFALHEINSDPKFHDHNDHDRIRREIEWLLEDAEGRLEQTINTLTDPRHDKSLWIHVNDNQIIGYDINSPGQATKIISDICEVIFPATPEINSEGLNRTNPTAQQARAAQSVIDAMFAREPSATFGIEGRGPDILALNSILKIPGILIQADDENASWIFGRPIHDERLAKVWDLIDEFIVNATQQTPIKPLLEQLKSTPYGLRSGIIPLLLGAVLRERIKVTTVWKGRSAIGAVTGETIYNMVEKPEDYSIKVDQWCEEYSYIWTALLQLFDNYILETERESQPLSMVSVAMLRWLQALPAFCRDTHQVSDSANQFRNVIRQGVRQPAKALFEMLPQLMTDDDLNSETSVYKCVDGLMQEISNAYLELQRRLDMFINETFADEGLSHDALISLKSWLANMDISVGHDIKEYKFGSMITQDFVDVVLHSSENDTHFWNNLAEALVGVTLRDWNDESESRFRERALTAREEIEQDVADLIDEDKAITLSIEIPETDKQDFRFRSSDLSSQGQRILQNFKSTMQVAGRPLHIDEKRRVALAFMVHIMGEDID